MSAQAHVDEAPTLGGCCRAASPTRTWLGEAQQPHLSFVVRCVGRGGHASNVEPDARVEC
jgi:hypothetical protein